MPYTDPDTELLFLSFKEWALERGIAADQSLFERLGDFVHARGGFEPALSLWDVAASALNVKLTKIPQPVEIDDSFRTEVQRMSSGELLKRINTDASFKFKFDALAQESAAPRSADAEAEIILTRQDYYSIPAATIARKYAGSPAFRRAVDRLIAAGQI